MIISQSKEQLDQNLGKSSKWFPKVLVPSPTYISGIEYYDTNVNDIPPAISLISRPNGLEISALKIKKFNVEKLLFGLSNDQISSINFEDKEQIFERKDKSVIGRALIGGVLMGPLGAILGGMSGIGEKEQKAKMPDLLLSISYKLEQSTGIILFSSEFKNKNLTISYFKENFKDKFFCE